MGVLAKKIIKLHTKLEIVSDELDSDIRLFLPSRRIYDKLV